MIANRKLAALAFAGGASLALLGGCSAYAPPPTYVSAYPASAYSYPAAPAVPEWFWHQGPGNQPDIAPVPQTAPRRGRRYYSPRNDDDGPVISDNPPAPTPAPVPQAPNDPDCVGWWRICHFL